MASLNSGNSQLQRPSSSSSSSSSSSGTKTGFVSDEETKIDSKKKKGSCSNIQNRNRSVSSMTVDNLLSNGYDSNDITESTLVDAKVTLIFDTSNPTHVPMPTTSNSAAFDNISNGPSSASKTVDDVWREIVAGNRQELKEEAFEEMITLEDFLLAKAQEVNAEDVKISETERLSGVVFPFEPIPLSPLQALDRVEGAIVAFGNGVEMIGCRREGGRGKRGRATLEPLDKDTRQRQRRMIKNRESAARSRERKQAHQVELESLAARLEEENEQLLKEKAERAKGRLKQLMEKVIPVVEKQRPSPVLHRVHSMEW